MIPACCPAPSLLWNPWRGLSLPTIFCASAQSALCKAGECRCSAPGTPNPPPGLPLSNQTLLALSPRFTFVLTAIGVVLAGLPLLSLTGKAGGGRVEAAGAAAVEADIPVVLTLRWSGSPTGLTLRHGGRLLGEVEPNPDGECELECRMPRAPYWEVEVEAEWPAVRSGNAQAVTLLLEPQAMPARAETQWTYPGESVLHRIFAVKGVEP